MSQEIRELISKNVRKYREKMGLSREELSLALNFDNSYISKLERMSINVTVDRLSLIAQKLNIKIAKLFSE